MYLWTIEKQLELVQSRIQYTAIVWIQEHLNCPNRDIFLRSSMRVANLYRRTPPATINIDDTALGDIRNTVFEFG